MKRITKILSVIISLMMVIGLLLPMGGFAGASSAPTFYVDGDQLETLLTTGSFNSVDLASGARINFLPTTGSSTHEITAALLPMVNLGTITLNLNANTLDLVIDHDFVLNLNNTTLIVEGTGRLNIRNPRTDETLDRNGLVMEGVNSGFIRAAESTATIDISARGAPINIINGTARLIDVTENISNVIGTTGSGPITVGSNSAVTISGDIETTGQGLVVNTAARVTLNGSISVGVYPAIRANGTNTRVTVDGDVIGGVIATAGANIDITGDILLATGTGTSPDIVAGISCNAADVTLTGDINVTGNNVAGVHAWNGSNVSVTGNISATGAAGVHTNTGVILGSATDPVGDNTVRVSGRITAARFIFFQTHAANTTGGRAEADYDEVVPVGTALYRQYDGPAGTAGWVRVRAGTGTGTVPSIPGNNGAVTIPVTQVGNTVTLNLTPELISSLITTATGTNPVRLNFSSAVATIASIPKSLFEAAEAANKAIRVDMQQGSIELNATAVKTLADRTEDDNIDISIHEQNVSALPSAQQSVINSTDAAYSVTITAGTAVTSFDTGASLNITLNYTGTFPAEVFHVSTTGILTRVNSTSNTTARTVTFTRSSLSIFIIRPIADTTGPGTGPNVPQTSDDVNILLLGVVALAAVSGLVVMIVIKKRFMTGNNK